MALHPPHGTAAEHGLPGPRVEVTPAKDMAIPPRKRGRRRHGGAGPTMPVFALAKAIAASPEFEPYLAGSLAFRDAAVAEYAELAGGDLGPTAQAWLEMAALEMAAGRFVFAQTARLSATESDDLKEVADLWAKAAKLNAGSRQHMLAAWEVAMRSTSGGDEPIDANEAAARAEARAAAKRQG